METDELLEAQVEASSAKIEEFLEHYGTRGMKWGVRKNIQSRSGAARAAFIKEKDSAWVGKVNENPKIGKIARIAARDTKRQTRRLKKDYKERGLNVKKNGLDRTRYDNELKSILQHSVERASHKVHGSSPTGLKEVQIHRHPDGSLSATIGTRDNAKIRKQQRKIARSDQKLGHADEGLLTAEEFDGLEFRFVLDDDGFVEDVLTDFDDELEQSDSVDAVLRHFGIPGMKWGHRRSRAQLSRAAGSSEKAGSKPPWQRAPNKKVRPASGASSNISNDQIIFQNLKARAKTHGIHSLSNDEIRVLTNRAEVLRKAQATFPKPQSKKQRVGKRAAKLIDDVLVNTGQQLLKDVVKFKGQEALRANNHLPKKDDADEALKKARKLVEDADKNQ